MKNLFTTFAITITLSLTACTSTGTSMSTDTGNGVGTATNVGMSIFKSAIDTQCRSELEKQNVWRVARVAMSSQQEEAAKSKVCSCVSEQAPQQVTVMDLTNATVDANYRQQLVIKVVAKSLQSCYANLTI